MPLFSVIHDEKQNSKMAKGSYGWIVGAYWLMALIMEWLGSGYINYLLLNNKLPINKQLKTTNIHHFNFSRSGIWAWPLDQGLSKGWWSRCWQRLQISQTQMVEDPLSSLFMWWLVSLIPCCCWFLATQNSYWDNMTDDFPQSYWLRVSKTEATVFCSPILEVASPHFCHILFFRSESKVQSVLKKKSRHTYGL